MRKWLIATTTAFAVGLGTLFATSADAAPKAAEPGPPVAGIAEPCAVQNPFPKDASTGEVADQLAETFGFKIAGRQWTTQHRAAIKILWETLDAVSCTDYLDDLQGKVSGTVGLNATNIRGYAWGDWSLTRSGYVSFDFSKFERAFDAGDEGRLSRLVIHELAHTLNSDRYSEPKYWRDFKKLARNEDRFSKYAGSSLTETFAEVVGYYVGRCALNNPYDTGKFDAYYAFARDRIFDGKEFGPAPGTKADCSAPKKKAKKAKAKPDTSAAWLEGLGGE
ncbi:MAG: hypothetical protein IPJ61_13865 [Tessaracoccus sp.]|uniref:hypothetical protein n=1 Tax=Tessaracoccus sp. TaxID=1971211 RepID=UPI001EBE9D50|nr:hypothetical protein [Tessaracoccus sp.]MBK7822112.1 hypothetical protein [Tessaracoccus sp.]